MSIRDGKAYNIAEGILRARHREGQDKPKLMEPGTIYRFEIDLLATSNAFLPGHRIRVDVTSSHFPQFNRHTNTGEPFGKGDKVKIATQTIQHTKARPVSRVLACDPISLAV